MRFESIRTEPGQDSNEGELVDEIDKRKCQIYDLMRKISQASEQVKTWREELARLDNEIIQLEANNG